jgi:N-acetylglucosaminyldiphosphoundecaprenol N-acetyl-beta-D-mannosaminyltransferase
MSQLKKQALERRRNDILGLLVDELTLDEAVAQIEGWINQRRKDPMAPARRVVTVNPEYVMAARRDQELRQIVNSADMVTPDGIGLILAGLVLRRPFRGRVTGVALSHALVQRSAQTGTRLFLLGAGPGISIVGVFDGKAGPEGDAESLARIQEARPDLVLVAYGMVKQDRWVLRNIEQSGATVAIGVGGVLDYVSGHVSLAPPLFRRLGLEWLYRLYKEPWRWRRQVALLDFIRAVAWQGAGNLKDFLYRKFRATR